MPCERPALIHVISPLDDPPVASPGSRGGGTSSETPATSPDASGHTGTIFGAPARPHHSARPGGPFRQSAGSPAPARGDRAGVVEDRKSTRLNSSHSQISYAVFCLKKKKINVR